MTAVSHSEADTALAERLAAAVTEYRSRRPGVRVPDGGYVHGVWLPSAGEARSCCRFHAPTRAPGSPACYPESARKHCAGVPHIARLYDVPTAALRRALRAL